MTDSKLRELERRWKETGAVEDEAAYLLARFSAGLLGRRELEWADFLGHQAAHLALAEIDRAERADRYSRRARRRRRRVHVKRQFSPGTRARAGEGSMWITCLVDWSAEACARAALALASEVVLRLPEGQRDYVLAQVRQAGQDLAHRRGRQEAAVADPVSVGGTLSETVVQRAILLVRKLQAGDLAEPANEALSEGLLDLARLASRAGLAEMEVLTTVRRAVAPWALGCDRRGPSAPPR